MADVVVRRVHRFQVRTVWLDAGDPVAVCACSNVPAGFAYVAMG